MPRFPVLNHQNCRPRKSLPASVPWDFAEEFRAQAELNHGQSLETLAARGGLAPQEMWLAERGLGLREICRIDAQQAIDWLCGELATRDVDPSAEASEPDPK